MYNTLSELVYGLLRGFGFMANPTLWGKYVEQLREAYNG